MGYDGTVVYYDRDQGNPLEDPGVTHIAIQIGPDEAYSLFGTYTLRPDVNGKALEREVVEGHIAVLARRDIAEKIFNFQERESVGNNGR